MFAVTVATGIGYLGANVMPMWLGALMDSMALGPEQAGRMGGAELLSGAVAALLVAPMAGRISRRRLATIACACAAAGYALSALAGSYAMLALIRMATGFFCGIVLAAGNAAAAGARDPDRVYAAVGFFAGVAASLIIVIVGYASGAGGFAGIFLLLTGVVLIAIPVLRWLPESVAKQQATASATTRLSSQPLFTLAAVLLLSISGQGLWAFTERIGDAIGLETEQIGWWISVSSLSGLGSAAFAAWLGTRLGRTFPITVAIALSGYSQWILVNANTEVAYIVALFGWGLALNFWFPFVMGLLAELDRGGRWTVVSGAVAMFGIAVGPWVAGRLQEESPDHGLATLLVGCAVAALLLLLPVSISFDRLAGRGSESDPAVAGID
jgi:predicted MFS family arabinose efflux permease